MYQWDERKKNQTKKRRKTSLKWKENSEERKEPNQNALKQIWVFLRFFHCMSILVCVSVWAHISHIYTWRNSLCLWMFFWSSSVSACLCCHLFAVFICLKIFAQIPCYATAIVVIPKKPAVSVFYQLCLENSYVSYQSFSNCFC